MQSSLKILLVVLGAAVGATLRYLVGGFIASVTPGSFPWGTLAANLSGCLFMGILWGIAERSGWPAHYRTFVFVGLLGSYTTFSSFGIETLSLFHAGLAVQAFGYVLMSNIGGLLLVWAGFSAVGLLAA